MRHLALAAALLSAPAAAQTDNRAVAAEVQRIIAGNYVVPGVRAKLTAALAGNIAAGRYDGLAPDVLAERLTADMAAIAHDGHLGIRFDPNQAAQTPVPRRDDDSRPDPFWDEQARRTNHGITELKVLDGNIRYMDYRGFMWAGGDGRASAAALDQAMAFLRGGDAIVIDLRGNGGGDPAAVRHLTSYFVPADTTLVTFYLRDEAPDVSRAEAAVPGGRITGKPVYVLTSPRTFSAAEEFASHVSRLRFGKLVGSATGGGAYRNAFYPVAGKYVLSVSIGRPELPGGGNWEGRGVAPAIAVAPEVALDAAQSDALRTIAAAASGPDRQRALRLAAYYDARVKPAPLARAATAYTGRYGERVVRLAGEALTIQRGGGPVNTLVPLAADRFALSNDPATQVTFRAEGGDVVALELDRGDGARETAEHRAN